MTPCMRCGRPMAGEWSKYGGSLVCTVCDPMQDEADRLRGERMGKEKLYRVLAAADSLVKEPLIAQLLAMPTLDESNRASAMSHLRELRAALEDLYRTEDHG